MSNLELYDKLKACVVEEEYFENFLVYQASWVIAGVKPAVTILINKKNQKLYNAWINHGEESIEKLGLKNVILRENHNAVILMVYDEKILDNHLDNIEYQEFFKKLGYPENFDLDSYIEVLIERYGIYKCPHELGLFLGIPFDDVKDFIECSAKKCLLCKYWKVYNNKDLAEKIFSQYDEIRNYTIKNILEGNSSHHIASGLKNSFCN